MHSSCLLQDFAPALNTSVLRSQTLWKASLKHTVSFTLLFPDDLHQAKEGDQEHILDLMSNKLPPRDSRQVDSAVLSLPAFTGLRLPTSCMR